MDNPIIVGVRINWVKPGSIAYAAGLKSGDVVIKVNEKNISDPQQFKDIMSALKPGDRATIVVWRDGEFLRTELEI